MEEKKIEIITKNSDGLFNKITVEILEDGSLNKTGDEIANITLEGDIDYIDTSSLNKLDSGDGHDYAEFYVNISDEHEDFDAVQEEVLRTGSYLDEVGSSLSDQDEDDHDSFIENLRAKSCAYSPKTKFFL